MSEDDKKAVEEASKALKDKLDSEDAEEIKRLSDDLSTKLQKVGEAMYAAADKAEGESDKSEEAKDKSKADEDKSEQAEEGEVVDKKEDK